VSEHITQEDLGTSDTKIEAALGWDMSVRGDPHDAL
jgi:hypothetical protein